MCRRQLAQLLGIIKATTPHYVRCIKPNPQSVPKAFARPDVVGQLRCADVRADGAPLEADVCVCVSYCCCCCSCGGVLEAVRVARLGYPVRLMHSLFMSQYRCLLPKSFPRRDGALPVGSRYRNR